VPFARALADAGADDSDEWVRAISCAVRGAAEGDNRFDLDGLRASVPAVSQAVTSIREAIHDAEKAKGVTTYRPKEEMYLPARDDAGANAAATTHGHFTLRERRQPRKKATVARAGQSSFDAAPSKAGDASGGRTSTSSMFVPARKPTGGTSFLRDTGRVGSFNAARSGASARAGGGMPRPGSKTMVIDVTEAAELGKSARSREQEAKEKRIQKLMEEREARKQQEESRKRQRDEEIAAKKKAYKAEIEAKRARKERDSACVATPSPTDEPTMWG